MNLRTAIAAEFYGMAILSLAVAGSGTMGEKLAAGNIAVALLANSFATAGALYVLLSMLSPISGAHLNPLVSLMEAMDGKLRRGILIGYLLAQFMGAVVGVWAVHLMFGQAIMQISRQPRTGLGLLLSELISTVTLLVLVRVASSRGDTRLPVYVALTVMVGYWATASSFFANPALSAARMLTESFSGIQPSDAVLFIGVQFLAWILVMVSTRLFRC